jgi:hypothetical protein
LEKTRWLSQDHHMHDSGQSSPVTGIRASQPPTTRHSARTVLDEGSRPSAAKPPPEFSASGMGVSAGSHLVEVHDHYRQELAQVRDVLAQVRDGAAGAVGVAEARATINAMTIRANNWTLGGICQAQCLSLTTHHTMEDGSIFGHLGRRDPDLKPVLARLSEEHLAIHDVLEEIDAALIHLVRNTGDYSRITEAIGLLTDTLLSHFAYEERELIGPLARFGFF